MRGGGGGGRHREECTISHGWGLRSKGDGRKESACVTKEMSAVENSCRLVGGDC